MIAARHLVVALKHGWRAGLLAACVGSASAAQAKPNVLFLLVDDLRPQLGCYGHAEMRTPNIDRLAATGVRMTRQFVSAPMCGPSRYAMLTGRHPSKPADLGNNAFDQLRRATADDAAPESIVDLFRRDGYRTVGLGKISHSPDGRVYGYDKPISEVREMPRSWDDMSLPYGQWGHGWQSFFGYADGTGRTDRLKASRPVPATEAADVADTGYPDGLIAEAAAAKLGELKRDGKPFFLAVGFFKPHLPFNAPKRYWDLYPESDLSPAPEPPLGVHPKLALHESVEAGQYTHPENWKADAAYHRHLRRGYRASVSYVDAQVGLVLDALERERLADDTIVLLWGDHGFHLGDLSIWGKHSLFDYSLHSPLIVRVPGTRHAGAAAEGIVESVDIYPTLADLCGLTPPAGLSGRSLRPMLEDPAAPGRAGAVSHWHNGAISLRTDRYRLTRYRRPNHRGTVDELYDLRDDPRETRNVAADRPEVVGELSPQLDRAAWPR